jgi:hypothetical protein
MEQLEPAATEPAQLFVLAKEVALVPLITMLVMVRAAVPELLSVIAFAALVLATFWSANTRLVGDGEAAATPTPVPLRLTVCVDPLVLPALSVTVRVAVLLPTALGENITAILQLEPAATLPPQLLVVEKFVEFVPLNAMLLMVRAAVPELLSVTV